MVSFPNPYTPSRCILVLPVLSIPSYRPSSASMPSPFVVSPSPFAPMRPCHPNKCSRPFARRKSSSCKRFTPSCPQHLVSPRNPMFRSPGNIITRMGNIASGKAHLLNSIGRLPPNTPLVDFLCLYEMWRLPRSLACGMLLAHQRSQKCLQ